jgi:hypothetical protein
VLKEQFPNKWRYIHRQIIDVINPKLSKINKIYILSIK